MKIVKKVLSMIICCSMIMGMLIVPIDTKAASKIKLSFSKLTLTVGNVRTLTLKQGGKKLKSVKWKTSNKKVATVSSKGKVTTKKAGSATITATYKKKAYKCKLTVKAKSSQKATEATKVDNTTQPATATPTTASTTAPTTTQEQKSSETKVVDPVGPSNPTPSDEQTPSLEQEQVSDTVVWNVSTEMYEGSFAYVDEEGKEQTENIQLKREYVSFDPWPTTNAQVQYVIKNCKDPYVLGALYVVALDNIEKPDSLSDYTNLVFDMLDSLQTGAGAISGSSYLLNNYAKQHINEYYSKQILLESGDKVNVRDFASRTFLKGATPYNNYMPESGDLEDKTTWEIIVDQYVYSCQQDEDTFDFVYDNPKWFTVCPRRYTENKDTETGPSVPVEHSQVLRLGFRWNNGKQVYLPTDYAKINTDPGTSALEPYNIQASILFSNDYMPPQEDQGW